MGLEPKKVVLVDSNQKEKKETTTKKKAVWQNDYFFEGKNIVWSVAVAIIVFVTSRAFIPDFSSFAVNVILSFIFAVLLLVAFDRVTKMSNPYVRKSAFLFILMFFFIWVVRHESKADSSENKSASTEVKSKKPRYQNLYFGENTFELEEGESTPWLISPDGLVSIMDINSANYDYDLMFSDGTSYQGSPSGVIPKKKLCDLKIRAHSYQVVSIKLTEKNP